MRQGCCGDDSGEDPQHHALNTGGGICLQNLGGEHLRDFTGAGGSKMTVGPFPGEGRQGTRQGTGLRLDEGKAKLCPQYPLQGERTAYLSVP